MGNFTRNLRKGRRNTNANQPSLNAEEQDELSEYTLKITAKSDKLINYLNEQGLKEHEVLATLINTLACAVAQTGVHPQKVLNLFANCLNYHEKMVAEAQKVPACFDTK